MPGEKTVETSGGGLQGGEAIFIFIIVLGIAINLLAIICWCRIVARLGYHWALGLLQIIPLMSWPWLSELDVPQWTRVLLLIIPLVVIIQIVIMAFSRAPNETKIRQLRRQIKQLEDAINGGAPPPQGAQRGRSGGRSGGRSEGRSDGRSGRKPQSDQRSDQERDDDAASALGDLGG